MSYLFPPFTSPPFPMQQQQCQVDTYHPTLFNTITVYMLTGLYLCIPWPTTDARKHDYFMCRCYISPHTWTNGKLFFFTLFLKQEEKFIFTLLLTWKTKIVFLCSSGKRQRLIFTCTRSTRSKLIDGYEGLNLDLQFDKMFLNMPFFTKLYPNLKMDVMS